MLANVLLGFVMLVKLLAPFAYDTSNVSYRVVSITPAYAQIGTTMTVTVTLERLGSNTNQDQCQMGVILPTPYGMESIYTMVTIHTEYDNSRNVFHAQLYIPNNSALRSMQYLTVNIKNCTYAPHYEYGGHTLFAIQAPASYLPTLMNKP
jgi:hypothetical protein